MNTDRLLKRIIHLARFAAILLFAQLFAKVFAGFFAFVCGTIILSVVSYFAFRWLEIVIHDCIKGNGNSLFKPIFSNAWGLYLTRILVGIFSIFCTEFICPGMSLANMGFLTMFIVSFAVARMNS